MVKLNMSTDGSENEFNSLTSTIDKLKIQQRLIDISARNLQSARLSCSEFPSSLTSSSEAQSTIEENVLLLEDKLIRGFSRQLSLKHQYLKQAEEEDDTCLEEARKELDRWIDLEMFLNVTNIEPRSVKVLVDGSLTLDSLFTMSTRDLRELLQRREIPVEDTRKLMSYLDFLTTFYEKWERGEKPSTHKFDRGCSATTPSRLGSVYTFGPFDQDGRTDSVSSNVTRSSCSTTPTPLTPSSSISFLSPTTHHPAVNLSYSPSPFNMSPAVSIPPTLNRSSSSSLFLDEGDTSCSAPHDPPKESHTEGTRYHRRYTHTRSHSNPPANLIINPEASSSSHNTTRISSVANRSDNCSPSPPSRAGSQPSVVSNSVTGSPSSIHKSHPQMRRILAQTPTFSQSFSNDQFGSADYNTPQHSHEYQSAFFRQNEYAMPRCSSLAEPRRSISSQPSYLSHEVTSTSMVDLPVTTATSSEHLDQIDEYPLPKSGKSQSVPKLTLMTVSAESDRGVQSTSVPTSPRTPGTFTPINARMGHAVMHRFTTKTFLTHPVCDYCKKTVMIGVKCKHCKYKCHKSCAPKVPYSCGLPRELMEYFRQHILLTSSPSPSVENFVSPSEHNASRPRLIKSNTHDADTREKDFVIPDLTKEPKNGQFSPVMSSKRAVANENGRVYPFVSQMSTSSLLEVPSISRVNRSTSSTPSPSTSPPTSPSLTPSSPRSPNDVYRYDYPQPQMNRYEYTQPHINTTYESTDEEWVDGDGIGKDIHILSEDVDESQGYSSYSSKESSTNDISDVTRLEVNSPRGLRPLPQIVLAQSLPDLLLPQGRKSTDSSDGSPTNLVNGYASDDYLHHQMVRRKESLQRTLSTADSKTSTLVNSLPTEEDDLDSESYMGSQGIPDDIPEYRQVRHRNSVVDEWNIPYSDIRIIELLGRDPVAEVYRGYWHGEVAIKRFYLPNATPEQISWFKEEVSVLKKTRHENLALFMGASLAPPNLAIVSSLCKGQTLYKTIHMWSEPFLVDKSIHIAKQIAQALGYLHARGIVHKDLNSRNVFLDSKDKVVITNTGISSLNDSIWIQQHGLNEQRCAIIPRTRLYYLAPEIVRVLSPNPVLQENGDLYPYSEKTDIYAFGTVLYELLTRQFPFSTDKFGFPLSATAVIFMVGRGERQEFHSREIPKRFKDLVWDCWHPQPHNRLPLSAIWDILAKLSRKKTPISRSPSFPVNLSISNECLTVF